MKLTVYDYDHLLNLIQYCNSQTNRTWRINGIYINNWDVSRVTDMNSLFLEIEFNENISNWNVSQVTDYEYYV